MQWFHWQLFVRSFSLEKSKILIRMHS